MKRLFIAIKINPDREFLQLYEELRTQLKFEKITWVSLHNVHITLKFLGDTPEDKVEAVAAGMKKAAEGISPFSFRLGGLGIFGSSYQPRVIWAGIKDWKELAGIGEKIIREMEVLGWERDRQNFVPHLTIGRIKFIKDKQTFQEVIGEYKHVDIQEVNVTEVRLYESELTRQGPVYTVIDRVELR